MSKTAPIHDDIHALIVDKQTELKRKHKITVKISDLIGIYVKYGVEKTEKLLGLKSKEEQDVVEDIRKDNEKNNGTEESAIKKADNN